MLGLIRRVSMSGSIPTTVRNIKASVIFLSFIHLHDTIFLNCFLLLLSDVGATVAESSAWARKSGERLFDSWEGSEFT